MFLKGIFFIRLPDFYKFNGILHNERQMLMKGILIFLHLHIVKDLRLKNNFFKDFFSPSFEHWCPKYDLIQKIKIHIEKVSIEMLFTVLWRCRWDLRLVWRSVTFWKCPYHQDQPCPKETPERKGKLVGIWSERFWYLMFGLLGTGFGVKKKFGVHTNVHKSNKTQNIALRTAF